MCWTEGGAHHPKAKQDLLPRGFISHDPRGQCQKSAQIPSQTWRQRVPSSVLCPQVKDRLGTGPGDVTVLHRPQEPGDCEKEALFWLPRLTKPIKTLLFAWHQ